MREVIITKEPVVLNGNSAILPKELIQRLEESRAEELRYQQSKHIDSNGCTIKPAPWTELKDNIFQAQFEWPADKEPEIVDQNYKSVPDKQLSTLSSIKAKLIFIQRGFSQNNGKTIGTCLHLKGIQLVSQG